MIARVGFICALMALTGIGVASLQQQKSSISVTTPDLEELVPSTLTGWQSVDVSSIVLPAELELVDGEAIVYRAYQDIAGRLVTLVAAYGPPHGDSVRLHRPESCYVAQGFTIDDRVVGTLNTDAAVIPIVHLQTRKLLRGEAVSYWLRDGDAFVADASSRQWLSLQDGLGTRTASTLIRVSSASTGDNDSQAAAQRHNEFLSAFVAELSGDAYALFIGERS